VRAAGIDLALADRAGVLPPARERGRIDVRRVAVTLSVLFLWAAASQAVLGADVGVRVIVHPQVKGNQMTRAALTQIFLRQAVKWGDGSPAQPVDQSVKSPVRSAFSNRLLERSVMEVQIYWNRRLSEGVMPPPVRTTDEEVLAFVARTPGAIGYVSSGVPLPDTVKAVEIAN
jgi:ABC-type phosphate transport system substrate-binding protein